MKIKIALVLFFCACLTKVCAQEVYLGYTAQEIEQMTPCFYHEGTIVCQDHVATHEFGHDGRTVAVVVFPDSSLRESMLDSFCEQPFIQTSRTSWLFIAGERKVEILHREKFIEYFLR